MEKSSQITPDRGDHAWKPHCMKEASLVKRNIKMKIKRDTVHLYKK